MLRTLTVLLALIAATLNVATTVSAESTTAAMKTFGIIGVWSPDCAKQPGTDEFRRITISSPVIGSPKFMVVPTIKPFDATITSATRITEEKIKLVFWATIDGRSGEGNIMFEKARNKIKVLPDMLGLYAELRDTPLEKCLN